MEVCTNEALKKIGDKKRPKAYDNDFYKPGSADFQNYKKILLKISKTASWKTSKIQNQKNWKKSDQRISCTEHGVG